jgi:hypothetical protein
VPKSLRFHKECYCLPMAAITISKLDAGRRQLETAITLWFNDGDPVSTHTLACAAYEIIHVVSSARNRTRDLLFDKLVVKDEYRSAWNQRLKEPANFFKHARNDPDGTPWRFITRPPKEDSL